MYTKKTLYATSILVGIVLTLIVTTTLFVPLIGNAQTALTSSLAVGSTGADVRSLQTFLALDPSMYPQGLITGYYGPLTRDAVIRFQTAHGISPVGVVGPITRAQINLMISNGIGFDTRAPSFSTLNVTPAANSANITFTTNEMARGKVYYDTRPLVMYETDRNFVEPYISGQVVSDAALAGGHSLTIPNLVPNTTYYYTTQATDQSGNVMLINQKTFTTL